MISQSARAYIARFAVATCALIAHAVLAQGPAPSPLFSPAPDASPAPIAASTPVPRFVPELTRTDLEPFLDALITSQIETRDIAGAVVSVVKDGEVVLSKGYGYADFAEKKPVLADETLFRPGSIGKLFTAIAVMQLVEAGKLDLDRDVRDYLDFEIPRRFPEPITLRRILTHTAGFEESLKNLFGAGPGAMPPREYLLAQMPAQVYRPGTVPAYSNYAIAIAGYIVERATEQRFEEYVAQQILQPLGMASSTFEQPLPEDLAARMSAGYTSAAKPPKPFEICNAAPAGSLSATGADMSRFMLALLNGGTLNGVAILQPGTLQMMQSRQHELHADLHAMGLGFMEYTRNGYTMWGHGGDTLLFHSDLFLIPEARVGLYVSYNSGGNRPGSGRGELQRAFLGRYFPEAPDIAPPSPSDETISRGREVSGVYEVTRRSETSWLRVASLLGQVRVTSNDRGILTIENSKNIRRRLKRWREVAPYSYREIDGPEAIAFSRNEDGSIRELLPNMPIYVAQRVSGFRSKAVLLPLVGGSLAFIALTLLLWPLAAIVRKRYGRTIAPDSRSRLLHRLSRGVCLLPIAMLAVLAWPMSRASEDVSFLGERANAYLHASHLLGWLACAGLIILILTTVRFWRTAGIGWWPRVHATLLMVATVVFLWFAWQYHLLSASTNF
jgi:CubicO group peptidase (beta-lactamase class C family)